MSARTGRPRAALIDRGVFFLAAILGALSIVVLKELGLSQLVVTIVPVGIMVLYAWLVVSSWTRFRLRYDQAGDNCYYLGFVYTLVSLGLALYHFERASSSAADQIIQNFGIALATTIVGIALRVLLHQMREDPVDVEAVSRSELRDEAARVSGQLSNMVRDVAAFRHRTQDELKHFAYETQQAAEEYRAAARTFAALSLRLGDRIEKVIERIEAIEVPPDVLDRRLRPAAEEIERLAAAAHKLAEVDQEREAHMNRRLEAVSRIGEVVEAMAEIPERMTAALEQMSASTKAMADMQATALALVARLEGSTRRIDKLAAIEPIVERIERLDRTQRRDRSWFRGLWGGTSDRAGANNVMEEGHSEMGGPSREKRDVRP